jgi:hypothetical protein
MTTKYNLKVSSPKISRHSEEHCKPKKTPSRDMNHPRLANRRVTELPSKQLNLYLKGKKRQNSLPLTPPPSQMSPTEEEKKFQKLNKRRQSTPALYSKHLQCQFSTLADSLNRLAIGRRFRTHKARNKSMDMLLDLENF